MALSKSKNYIVFYGLVGLLVPSAYLVMKYFDLFEVTSIIHSVTAVLWFTQSITYFYKFFGETGALIFSVVLNGGIYLLVGLMFCLAGKLRVIFFTLTLGLVLSWGYFLLGNNFLEIFLCLSMWLLLFIAANLLQRNNLFENN